MLPLQKLTLMLLCIFFTQSIDAQSALKKAESYAKLDAPFLSIKYLQKHIRKQKEDRSAMRLLANAYLQVNMVTQGQKWLLRANNSPAVFNYFQKRNERKLVQQQKKELLEQKAVDQSKNLVSPNSKGQKTVMEDQLFFVAAIGTFGSII